MLSQIQLLTVSRHDDHAAIVQHMHWNVGEDGKGRDLARSCGVTPKALLIVRADRVGDADRGLPHKIAER